MRSGRWILFIVLAEMIAFDVRGKVPREDRYGPDFVLDLRQFGYEKPEKFHEQAEYQTLGNPIVFLDDDTLAISLFVRNLNPGLSVRNKVLGGPYLFETVFLDARSGKILRSQTWSNAGIGYGLFPASNGAFVVQHGLELSLYGPDGILLKSASLDSKDFPRTASLKQSPSGNTLFAVRSDREGEHVLRVRTSDLELLGWMHLAGYFSEAGSDSYFAYVRAAPRTPLSESGWEGPPMQLFVRGNEGNDSGPAGLRPIFTTPAPGCDSVVFLDNKTIGLSGQCHHSIILDTDGRILYQRRFEGELTSRMFGCRSCDLIAFTTYVLRGGSSWLDTFPKAHGRKIVLVDRKTLQSVEIPDSSLAHYIALSPDGCLLATQRDSQVEVYGICGSPIGNKLHATDGTQRRFPGP